MYIYIYLYLYIYIYICIRPEAASATRRSAGASARSWSARAPWRPGGKLNHANHNTIQTCSRLLNVNIIAHV